MKVLKQKDDKQTVTRPCGGCGADRSSQQQNLGPDSRLHSTVTLIEMQNFHSLGVRAVSRVSSARTIKEKLNWFSIELEVFWNLLILLPPNFIFQFSSQIH